MKNILTKLFQHQTLSQQQAYDIMLQIGKGEFSEHELTAFTTVFLMRSITLQELIGFREAILHLSLPIQLYATDAIDIVGTGGDGKNTFNISTLACFIVAGAKHKVIKHGNYAASSISGSSNVLEFLGYKFKKDEELLNKELSTVGICFLHAPLFHPALKNVATLRKNLGVKTFFNLLGPLVNPAKPAYTLLGVANAATLRLYQYFIQQQKRSYTLIYTTDGYDEISLTADTKVVTASTETVKSPYELGKRTVTATDLFGGATISDAAKIFTKILNGKGSFSQNAVVLANAAMALYSTQRYLTYQDAYNAAVESLDSGAALHVFNTLINMQ